MQRVILVLSMGGVVTKSQRSILVEYEVNHAGNAVFQRYIMYELFTIASVDKIPVYIK